MSHHHGVVSSPACKYLSPWSGDFITPRPTWRVRLEKRTGERVGGQIGCFVMIRRRRLRSKGGWAELCWCRHVGRQAGRHTPSLSELIQFSLGLPRARLHSNKRLDSRCVFLWGYAAACFWWCSPLLCLVQHHHIWYRCAAQSSHLHRDT